MNWTKEAIQDITRRWQEGQSATTIGDAIGRTRGAVIGKLHRLGVVRQRDKALDGPRPISLPKVGMNE